MNAHRWGNLGRPGATSVERLPRSKANEIKAWLCVGADGATCFNSYVWRCAILIRSCGDIKRVAQGCPICPKAPESRANIDQFAGQPRISSCPRLPQVAPVWLS
jgi:hypothetical protein